MQLPDQEWSFKKFFIPLTTIKAIHIIIIVGFLVFSNMLFNGFVWDDITYILNNKDIHVINIPYLFSQNSFNMIGQYRPFPALYFSIMHSLFYDVTFFYHLLQLSIHITNAILLFLLFKYFFDKKLSLFLSLIFLVHPMQVESVSYIAQTPSSLVFLFGIIAILICIKSKLTTKKTFAIFILLLLSALTKESGILFTIQLLLWKFLYNKKHLIKYIFFGVCIVLIYFFLRTQIGGITPYVSSVVPIATLPFYERIMNVPAIVFYYLKTFIYPKDLVVMQDWIVNSSSLQSFYLPLVLVCFFFILVILFGVYLLKKNLHALKAYIFFLAWFIIGLVPFLQIFPINGTVADRWFYYSMVGLLGLIGIILQLILAKKLLSKTIIVILCVILVTSLSVRTVMRNTNWKDAKTLLLHDSQILDSYNIEANLSTEYKKEGKIDDAIYHLKKSVSYVPYEVNLQNLAVLYEQKGEIDLARQYFLRATTAKSHWYPIHKRDITVYLNVIPFLIRYNDLTSAYKLQKEAIVDYPNAQEVWILEAFIKEELGDHQGAINAAQRANMLRQTTYSQKIYLNLINNKSIKELL